MSFVERRRFLWILFLSALASLAIFAVATRGTTLARLSFSELARKSAAVARLRCISAEPLWQNGEIWTESRFEAVEREKGLLGGIVTVRMPGGTTGGLHARVDASPSFHAGEEVYLFLWGQPDQPYRVLGWAQGTFRIRRDSRTGAESVTQDSATAAVFDPQTKQFRNDGIRNLPVESFRVKLRAALAEAN